MQKPFGLFLVSFGFLSIQHFQVISMNKTLVLATVIAAAALVA